MKTKFPEKITGVELVASAEALIRKLDYMIVALRKSRGSTAAPSFFSSEVLLVVRSELMSTKDMFVSHSKIWEIESQKQVSSEKQRLIEAEIQILADQLEKSYANAAQAYGELYRVMLDVLNADSNEDTLYLHPDDLASTKGEKIVLKIK